MSTLKVDTILKRSGTGTITLGQSGDTLTIPTGSSLSLPGGINGQALTTDGSGTLSFATVGGVMTPAFEAYKASSANVNDNTAEKMVYDTESFDVGGCYDHSSNYRFTPTTAGKYYVYSIVRGGPSSGLSACEKLFIYIYKNGSLYGPGVNVDFRSNNGTSASLLIASTIDFNGSSDYVEIYANIDVSSGTPTIYANRTIFGAYKIIT